MLLTMTMTMAERKASQPRNRREAQPVRRGPWLGAGSVGQKGRKGEGGVGDAGSTGILWLLLGSKGLSLPPLGQSKAAGPLMDSWSPWMPSASVPTVLSFPPF